MDITITAITFDSSDAAASARFWAEVLGATVADGATAEWATVAQPGGLPLCFARVPEAKSAKNRMHLDLAVDDLDVEVKRLEALGATELARYDEPSRWVTMADPDGNELCLVAA
jgi:predicted enzyme related to lactoylglutathione lyase